MDSKIVMELFYDVMHLMKKQTIITSDNQNPYLGQLKCLYQISQTGKISQRNLSEVLHIRANSLSETISKLEQKELVKREQSKEDKRTYMVSLTEAGEKEIEKIRNARADAHIDCLEYLTVGEKEQFYRILKKIQSHYNKEEP